MLTVPNEGDQVTLCKRLDSAYLTAYGRGVLVATTWAAEVGGLFLSESQGYLVRRVFAAGTTQPHPIKPSDRDLQRPTKATH